MIPDSADRLATALKDRYTIERELGRGGNAVVYLAHDRKHDRKVAVKVLTPELALSVRTERFVREIAIAARLTHPHILPLLDSGEAAGQLYYVMPFVEGESLRERLMRERQLPLDDALQITREVAAALSNAHEHGVVHRDIKPENILLASGHAVVADFGIARALTVAGGQTVTQSGVAVGTPAYMSPEQAAGSGEVDARSDVYSLGCVLYEMLAGRAPFTGGTAQEILARHALDPVPSVRAARSDVPEAMDRVIAKALAKQPIGRLPTAAAFVTALSAALTGGARPRGPRRLVYASLVLLLLAGAALAGRAFILSARATERSVGVIPVVNLSGDPANEYLSDGITEELINALVQIEGLRVPARTSSFYFKGKTLTARQIGDSLDVATVLEASLRKTGDKLRITAQLINARDGYHLWSQTFDREFEAVQDVIGIQEEIARAIVAALEVKLAGGDAAHLVARPPQNLAAYDDYLRGRSFFHRRTRDDVLNAIAHFRRAIAQDSGFAAAWSGLADASLEAGLRSYVPRERAYPEAKTAALQALLLDSNLAEAHTSLGRVRLEYDRDFAGAEEASRRAIRLNPRYALAHSWYSRLLIRTNRFDEAIAEGRLALELDPLSPGIHHELGNSYHTARQWDRAVEHCRRAVDLQPNYGPARQALGTTYLAKGMLEEALAELQIALRVGATTGGALARIGVVYARQGRREEAFAILRQMEARAQSEQIAETSIAILLVALGDHTRAIELLEQAAADRIGNTFLVPLARNSELFDPLRSDPRFQALLQKLEADL